jgi:hypothetical protein
VDALTFQMEQIRKQEQQAAPGFEGVTDSIL